MTKRKATGAGKKAPAQTHTRKSKSVPLSGPKDAVKRFAPKPPAASARRPDATKNATSTKKKSDARTTEFPSVLEAQMRFFESMVQLTPFGYFMRVQRLAREAGTAKGRSS
jgi:hypothetical protein